MSEQQIYAGEQISGESASADVIELARRVVDTHNQAQTPQVDTTRTVEAFDRQILHGEGVTTVVEVINDAVTIAGVLGELRRVA